MPVEQLLRGVWGMRGRALLAVLGLWVLGAVAVLSWPRQHVAEAVVAPAETTGLAASNLIQGQVAIGGGGLLETRPTGNYAIYLATLRSPEAAAMLARDTDLLARLAEARAASLLGRLRAALGETAAPADLDDARRWLERGLAVTPSLATATTVLALRHPDREAALDALERLHAFAEGRVRSELSDLARRRVAALEGQLLAERDIYLRTPIFELLAQHQRASVVAKTGEAVAARLVSAPSAALSPVLPNRTLLLGLLLVSAPLLVLTLAACAVLLGQPAAPLAPPRGGGRLPALSVARSPEE